MTIDKIENMNNIFVVTANLVDECRITNTTDSEYYILRAFGTKREAFEFIERLYYSIINLINENDVGGILKVYIGDNDVHIRGFYKLFYNESIRQFLYKYRIEKIPFE